MALYYRRFVGKRLPTLSNRIVTLCCRMTESTSTAREIPVDISSSDVDVRPQTRSLPPSTRGRMGKVSGVRIAATGSYVPEQIVTNEDLAALGCDSEWIIRRTGIRERRHAAAAQATSDLCYEAACGKQTLPPTRSI